MKNITQLLLFFLFFQNAHSQSSGLLSDRVGFPKHSTIDRMALSNLSAGQVVFDTDIKALFLYDGIDWIKMKAETEITADLIKLGEAQYSEGFYTAGDANGNIFLGGFSTGEVILDNVTINAGTNNLFLAKYNPQGQLLWHKVFGGTDEEQMGNIEVDGNGNIYFTGNFRSNFTNGGTTFTGSATDFDAFLSKFDNDGNHLWSVRETGTSYFAKGHKVVIDNSGNATVIGQFSGSSNFNGTVINSSGDYDIFLAQYSSSGSLNWVKSFGGTGQDLPRDLQVNSSGELLAAGQLIGTATLGSVSLSSYSGGLDVFVLKLNSSGTALWGRVFGGIGGEQEIRAGFTGIGGAIVSLQYEYPFDFQNIYFESATIGNMIALIKLDNNGALGWYRIDGRVSGNSSVYINSVLEKNDEIYLLGNSSNGTTYFGTETLNTPTVNAFIAKYQSNTGDFKQIIQTDGSFGSSCNDAKLGLNNKLILTGSFIGQMKFSDTFIKTNTNKYGLKVISVN